MVRYLTAVAVLFTVLVAAPAQADDTVPTLVSTNVCVRPDFAQTGSGWRVQQAIDAWNEAQDVLTFSTSVTYDCSLVRVHRYTSTTDGWCGYTSWSEGWQSLRWVDYEYRTGIVDVYLNDVCSLMDKPSSINVVAHELGHAIGMEHSTSRRSVMCNANCSLRRMHVVIAPVDVRTVQALYAGRY